jgi:hypothetical protein
LGWTILAAQRVRHNPSRLQSAAKVDIAVRYANILQPILRRFIPVWRRPASGVTLRENQDSAIF